MIEKYILGEEQMVVEQTLRSLHTVNELVEYVSAVTNKAVILENGDFELIAYSAPNEYSFDSIQQKTILTKRCPLYVIEHLKKDGIVAKLKETNKPIRVQLLEDTHFYQRLAMSVQYRGKLFGYLWIYEAEKMFGEEQLSLISKVAEKIGEILYKQQSNVEDDRSSLLWKLVNDEFSSKAEVKQAMKQTRFQMPNEYAIVVISVKEARNVQILEKIESILTSYYFVSYLGKGTEIITLIPGNNEKELENNLHRMIEQLSYEFNPHTFSIGIGNSYSDVAYIRTSYLQALEVIETVTFLNLSNKHVFYYDDIGMYRHLKTMYKKNVSEQYRNKKIVTLMQKDFTSKSELVKTLFYFLKNDSKVKQTADDLFIHPNTLQYRLKQIGELISIDFTDMMEKTSLFSELYLIYNVRDYFEFYAELIRPKG